MTEIWKDTEFENYEVSTFGNIRKKDSQKLLHQCFSENKGCCVSINSKKYLVHRIVAKAFLEGKENEVVTHINKDLKDNSVKNLKYISRGYVQQKHSRYIGVCISRDNKTKWTAYLRTKSGVRKTRTCATEKEAAIEYNKMALEFFGKDATLNTIE
jgi:hypothetical protein